MSSPQYFPPSLLFNSQLSLISSSPVQQDLQFLKNPSLLDEFKEQLEVPFSLDAFLDTNANPEYFSQNEFTPYIQHNSERFLSQQVEDPLHIYQFNEQQYLEKSLAKNETQQIVLANGEKKEEQQKQSSIKQIKKPNKFNGAYYNLLQVYFQEKKRKNEDCQVRIKKIDSVEEKRRKYNEIKQLEDQKIQQIQQKQIAVLKEKRKRRPLIIQQRAFAQEKLYTLIDVDYNFMLYGDFCICKQVFQDIDFEQIKASCCPINYFRPPIRVIRGKSYCLAQLNSSYNGIKDVKAAAAMLSSLQQREAKSLSNFLIDRYSLKLIELEQFAKNVLQHNKTLSKVQEIVAQNHAISFKMAIDIIEKLDANQIVALHYKKIDALTLAHKQYLVGGNRGFCNLFMGSQNLDILSQLMSRWGLPHYMDAKGIINLSCLILSDNPTFEMNMVTYDGFDVPLTVTLQRINLHQFEIMPGCMLSDFLEIRVMNCNPKLLDSIYKHRFLSPKTVMEAFKLDDFHYTDQAQEFISKYYESDKQTSLQKKNSFI